MNKRGIPTKPDIEYEEKPSISDSDLAQTGPAERRDDHGRLRDGPNR